MLKRRPARCYNAEKRLSPLSQKAYGAQPVAPESFGHEIRRQHHNQRIYRPEVIRLRMRKIIS
jgi:hypothetical protein